ncbi:rho guanine nucleotide exchange factor 15-like [Salvelinus fontinalis]|uniref:rho guanine nucleotide exchange factor 15-like n=1 Tax=Salvelinus fontinalis TaxID=8038 RepID=UPI0024856177|nr:rho guanine nucleotide exchange factor 15-like [Salvelinus fontinalis]
MIVSRLRPRAVVPPNPSNLKPLGPNIPNHFQTRNQNRPNPNQPPSGERSQERKQHQPPEGKVKRIVRKFSSQENEVMGQAGLETRTGAETVTGAKQGDGGVVGWTRTRTEAGQQADSNRGQTRARQADHDAIIMSPSVELSIIPPPVPLRKPRSGPHTQPTAQPTAQSDAVPLGQETDNHPCTLHTPGHGRGNRSAPDGSEVDEAPVCVAIESGQTPGSAATPSGHHGNTAQCQCICHLRRTGMKLVWVPLEEEEDNYLEVIGDEEKDKRGNEHQKRVVKEGKEEEEDDYIDVAGDEEKEKRGNEDQKRERKEVNEEMLGPFRADERGGKSQTGCQTETAAVFSEHREVRVHEVSENNSQISFPSKHNTSSNAESSLALMICSQHSSYQHSTQQHSSHQHSSHQHSSHTKQIRPPQNKTETYEEVTYEAMPMFDREEPHPPPLPPPRLMKPPLTHKTQHPSPPKDHLQRTLLQSMSTPSLSGLLISSSKSDIQKSKPSPQTPPSISNGNSHQPILRPLPPLPVLHDLRLLPSPIMPRPPQLRPQIPMKPLPPNPEPSGPSRPSLHSSTDADVRDDWVTVDEKDLEEPQEQADSPRRISSDWGPLRLDEPLYQIYQAKSIKEAIQLQSISRSASRATVDLHMRLRGGGSLGAPEGQSSRARKGPAEVTLWQELPVVRDSGILERLSPEELQRQESMFEVLTSEASYLHSLNVLTDHFLMCRDLDDTLLIHDKKTLFSNILQVYEVSQRFLKDLLNRIDENILITDVCDIIHQYALYDFSVYIDYIRNQGYQERAYSSLMQTNNPFALVMRRLEESPLCRRLPFSSFLLLPFQRITRIKILVQNILKRTKEGTREENTASRALTSVSEIIKESNTQVGQMKQMEELIQVSNTLEFNKLKAVPIVSKARFLEKRGELYELSKGASLFSARLKLTPIYLFLFNDLLIITCKKSSERYMVTDHTHRSLVQVQPTGFGAGAEDPGPKLEHSFCLLLLENHRGLACEHLLKAHSESDMHRWMAAFPSINDPNRKKEEVIYEDWDCPQVQCVEQYVAQQADELTMEPADIINVLRKTHEGWYKGMRLSDGEKGWFPSKSVVEITNEHRRRRNLQEQYRIAQAAAKVTKN